MITTDYVDVLNLTADLCGLDRDNLGTDEFSIVRGLHRDRLQTAWEHDFWPDLMRSEQRWFRLDWSSATAYVATNEVFYPSTQTYYQALQSSTNQAPATGSPLAENSAYWAESGTSYSASDWVTATAYSIGDQVYYPVTNRHYQCHTAHTSSATLVPDATGGNARWGVLTEFDRYVPYEQTSETKLGDVIAVWDLNPKTRNYDADPLNWWLSENGVQVANNVVECWIEFRLRVPLLKGATYSATATYAVDDQVYFSSATVRGNFYDCIVATTAGQSPTTTAASWDKVEIPLNFARYLEHGAASDWHRMNGVSDQADREDKIAESALSNAASIFRSQSGQIRQPTVLTR